MPYLYNKYKNVLRLGVFLFCLFAVYRGFFFEGSWARSSLSKDQTPNFKLIDVTVSSGVDFVHQQEGVFSPVFKNVEPWVTSQGSSVSVVDINNDDFPDIYLTTTKFKTDNKLFINQKNGTFIDQAQAYNLADINKNGATLRSLFFDCDNDGDQEVFILTESCPRLYKKDKKTSKYALMSLSPPIESCTPSVSANMIDYNSDGLLDIVYSGTTGNSFGRSYGYLPMGFVSANNGGPTFVFKNKGQCQFESVQIMDRQKENLFTNAIGVGDFRGVNSQDIWFATDFNSDRNYIKVNNDKFEYSKNMIEHSLAKSGMSSEHAFLGDNLVPNVFVAHVYHRGYTPYGNNLWKFNGSNFVDQAPKMGVQDCGWSWGAKFVDMNNDGFSDLYVANGFFANETDSKSTKTAKDYWYFFGVVTSAPRSLTPNASKWPNMTGTQLSGEERDCFFINDKNNKFYDAANQLDIDHEKLNGRGVASLDINSNGNMGLVITNQKNKAYIYQSVQNNTNHWIGFKLIGSKSNRDAVGAKMRIYLNNNTNNEIPVKFLTAEVAPYNGYVSQSDSRLHFGLGQMSGDTVNIEINWPSGIVQKVMNLKINTYHKISEAE